MKSINIKLNLNGSISVKEVDSLFLNENNACEVLIDYSSVVKEGWSIAVDLQPQYENATEINANTPGFISDENNVFKVYLSENYTKRNELRIQPKQVKSDGIVMEKIKYDVYTKKFKQSINATESESAVEQSIADQILASEQVRDSNENVRIANEEARMVYENYNPLATYVVGNKVSHNGSSYVCISETTGNLPNNSTYWLLIASQGIQGKSIVSASFVGNDIVFINDENEEIVITGGKTALIGSNAYQVWLEAGNTGTVEDYLASLIGPQGNSGYTPVKGTDYFDGDDGLSAYQVWLAQGNVGTEAQFLAKLKGNQWKGSYNPSTQYVVDDVVSYNGSSYICILASLGNIPSNTTYWSLFAQAGEVTTAAMNTALANKADKLFATNLVDNGDFNNGANGWILGSGITVTQQVDGIILTFNGTAATYALDFSGARVLDNKYFGLMKFRALSSGISSVWYRVADVVGLELAAMTQSNPTIDTDYTIKGNVTCPSNGSYLGNIRIAFATAGDSLNKQVKLYRNEILNLTSIFGLGKEPTKEQMDWLLSKKFTNSWFNGTAELTSITDLLTLVNTKANITQEAYKTLTLLNGWTGTLRIAKNSLGMVTIIADLVMGVSTYLTSIVDLPTGYIPPYVSPLLPLRDASSSGTFSVQLYIGSSIRIVTGGATGRIVQGSLTYYAGV